MRKKKAKFVGCGQVPTSLGPLHPRLRCCRASVPLLSAEYEALRRYSNRKGPRMSRILLALLEKSIREIQAGGDPLGNISGRSREPAA